MIWGVGWSVSYLEERLKNQIHKNVEYYLPPRKRSNITIVTIFVGGGISVNSSLGSPILLQPSDNVSFNISYVF